MFNSYDLKDEEVLHIIEKYENLINKYSRLYTNGPIDEDLRQEIILKIYVTLTQNRENWKIFACFAGVEKGPSDGWTLCP